MYLKITIFILFTLMLFACSNSQQKEKKELSGPHSVIIIAIAENQIEKTQLGENSDKQNSLKYYSSLLRSDAVLSKVALKLGKNNPEKTIPFIREQLEIEEINKTRILAINFYNEDYDYATALLDTLAVVFNEIVMSENYAIVDAKIKKCTSELNTVKAKIEMAEQNKDESSISREEAFYVKLLELRTTLSIERAGIISPLRVLEKAKWVKK